MLSKLAKSCQKSDPYMKAVAVMYMLSGFLFFCLFFNEGCNKNPTLYITATLKCIKSLSLPLC